MFEHINWMAVVVAGLAFYALGAVWYSALFGRKWAVLAGIDWENPGGNMAVIFGLTLVLEVVMAAVMASVLEFSGYTSLMGGLHVGLMIGLGVVTPAIAINNLYQRKSFALTAIDGGHMALGLAIVGAILGAWQ